MKLSITKSAQLREILKGFLSLVIGLQPLIMWSQPSQAAGVGYISSLLTDREFSFTDFHSNTNAGVFIRDHFTPDYYRTLGLNPTNGNVTEEMIAEAAKSIPTAFNEGSVRATSSDLSTFESRAQLITKWERVLLILEQGGATNLTSIQRGNAKAIEAEFNAQIERGERVKPTQFMETAQRAQIASLEDLINKYLPSYKEAGLRVFNKAGEVLTSRQDRLKFNVRYGMSFKLGSGIYWGNSTQMRTSVRDADGKFRKLQTGYESMEEFKSFKPSRLIEQLKNPELAKQGILMTSGTVAFLAAIHAYSYTQLTSNPGAAEDSWNNMVNILFATSFIGFFGASYTWSAVSSQLSRLYETGHLMVQNRSAFTNKQYRSMQAKINMGLSASAMGIGVLAQFATLYSGKYLMACLPLFNDIPLEERNMSQKERQQTQEMCDMGYTKFIESVSPTALKQAMFMMAGWRFVQGAAARIVALEASKIGQSLAKELRLIAVGSKIKNILVFTGYGIGLSLITYGLQELLDPIQNRYTFFRPAVNKREDLKESLSTLNQREWTWDEQACDEIINYSDDKTISPEFIKCEYEKVNRQVDDYMDASIKYRQFLLKDTVETISNWMDNYGRALNVYTAAKIFYRDLVQQIAERRKEAVPFEMWPPQNNKGVKRDRVNLDNISLHMSEKLSLFRSHPYFGILPQEDSLESLGVPKNFNYVSIADYSLSESRKNNDISKKYLQTQVYETLSSKFKQLASFMNKNDIQVTVQVLHLLESTRPVDHAKAIMLLSQLDLRSHFVSCEDRERTQSDDANCLLYDTYKSISDPKIYRGLKAPYRPGYELYVNDPAKGARPLMPGYEYLANYGTQRLASMGVDYQWYPDFMAQRNMKSMSEYLLNSLFCGNNIGELVHRRWKGWRWNFTPPKLPLNSKLDICSYLTKPEIRENPTRPYFYIPNPEDNEKPFYGFVDLLYRELGDEVSTPEKFEKWWKQNVTPEFTKLFEIDNLEFQEEVIDGKFAKIVEDTESAKVWGVFGGEIKKGYKSSLIEEFDFLVNNFFRPYYQQLDLSYSQFPDGKKPGDFNKEAYFEKLVEEVKSAISGEDISHFTLVHKDDYFEALADYQKRLTKSLYSFFYLFREASFGQIVDNGYLRGTSFYNAVNSENLLTEDELKKMTGSIMGLKEFMCGQPNTPEVIYNDNKPVLDDDGQQLMNQICQTPAVTSNARGIVGNIMYKFTAEANEFANLILISNLLKKYEKEL